MTAPGFDIDGMLQSTVRGKFQYEKMQTALYRDDHDREWSCQISIESMEPCTPMSPSDFRTPHPYLTPPGKYLRTSRGRLGRLSIDYDQWLTDVSEARREWDNWLRECAVSMYKGAAMAMIQAQDSDLMKMAGPAPMSPEFILAMKSGESRWVLGQLPKGAPTPKWAQGILHTLQIIETWDGGYVDTTVLPGKYADDETDEDAQERADRLMAALKYSDNEEDADPMGLLTFEPLPKKRSHHKVKE